MGAKPPDDEFIPFLPDYGQLFMDTEVGFWRITLGPEGRAGSILTADRHFIALTPDDGWRGSSRDFNGFAEAWFHPDDLGQIMANLDSFYLSDKTTYRNDHRIKSRDGRSWTWFHVSGSAGDRDERGRPRRINGAIISINERVRIKADLENALIAQKKALQTAAEEHERLTAVKEQMELIFSAAHIGAWDCDLPSETIKFNDVYLEMLGYRQEEIRGTLAEWDSFVHPDDLGRANAALERLLKGEDRTYAQELRMRHKDGRYVWTYDFGRVAEWDEQGRAVRVMGGHLDFDERKKLELEFQALREQEREMRLARDLAEESARAKSEFLANMSHEIRTPMNAILGLTHLALETTDLNERQYEYVYRTEVAAKNLLRIINDILDFSKIEAGKLEMEEIEFHLGDMLCGSMELLADKANDKGLEFALDLPAKTPCGLLGDPVRLTQIVNNLITNAIKFTEKGSVIVRVSALESDKDTVFLRFTVEDTGIGLTEEQAGKLFSPFTQADISTTRKYGGTGLGLTISKRLAEMMGGEIWCRGEPGRGSVFGFTARFKPCAAAYEKERRPMTLNAFKGLKALAVDDNPPALEILVNALTALGFETLKADSGREALAIFEETIKSGAKLDLILVDWKMPDMDGLETIRRLNLTAAPDQAADDQAAPDQAASRTLPSALMVTGHDREEVAAQARDLSIRQVLTKPISMSSLNDAVMEIFGRNKAKAGRKKGGASEDELKLIEPLRGSRILLVEDNEVNQLVASRILANAGFEVTIAGNGLEALDILERETFDLALMDIQMPEMDGLTAARRLREQPKFNDLPIVAMTAHAMSGDRELSFKAGMNDHVNKPINVSELFQALARWMKPKAALINSAPAVDLRDD